jgi:hypothetical protein
VRQRGRQSKVARQVDRQFKVIEGGFGGKRPDPPEGLSERSKALWRAIVNDEPADLFATTATRDMLTDYCFYREKIEDLKAQINEFPAEGYKSSKGRAILLQLRRAISGFTRDAASAARQLRMTNQSRYRPENASTASRNTLKGIKPWEL